MNNPYSILASYYDRLMSDYNYTGIYNYIINNISGKKGLDIACGTGKLTIELAYNGYNVTGIDISPEMLNIATLSAREKGVKVTFAEGDINNLEIGTGYDFVIATCDVINYLRPHSIEGFFSNINKALKKGSILIFDYSSRYKLVEIVGNNLFYEDYDDVTYIWDNSLNDNSVTMNLTFFVNCSKNYSRYDEQHKQYIYELQDIKELLGKTGFDLIDIIDGDSLDEIQDNSKRVLIRAGKR